MVVNKNKRNPFLANEPKLYLLRYENGRIKMEELTGNGLIVTTFQKNNHTNVGEDLMRNRVLITFGARHGAQKTAYWE